MDWQSRIAQGEKIDIEFKSDRQPLADRELGKPAAYVRTRGFEQLQMTSMIEQYVRAHGKIARRDVVSLCQVNEDRARYLLSKLVSEGRLQLVGKGRGAYYESAKTRKPSG